jgi:hypothetical protein
MSRIELSNGIAMKRKDQLLGLHETKNLLHSKGNGHQAEETAHSMGEHLCQLHN